MIPFFAKSNFIMKVMESTTTSVVPGKVNLTFKNQKGGEVKQPFEFMLGCMDDCKILAIQHQAAKHNIQIDKIVMQSRAVYNKDFILGEKEENETEKNTFKEIETHARIYSSDPDKEKLREVVLKGITCSPIANTLKLAGVNLKSEIELL